uniref:Uncharacterized protein n=1 Tax=Tolypothrix bouteillei VB521301 TaxID=1479485 RepID=A0A0C1RIC8_9CYAN
MPILLIMNLISLNKSLNGKRKHQVGFNCVAMTSELLILLASVALALAISDSLMLLKFQQ